MAGEGLEREHGGDGQTKDEEELTHDTEPSVTKNTGAIKDHALYCFDVLYAHMYDEAPPEASFASEGNNNKSESSRTKRRKHGSTSSLGSGSISDEPAFPLFVTWNIMQSGTPVLRGCIGSFEPQPLSEGLAEYAVVSATRDRRFSPVSSVDLCRLQCCVSLLTNFEDAIDHLDWTVGVHGIYIHLPNPALHPPPITTPSSSSSASTRKPKSQSPRRLDRSTILSATYLPEIAPVQGWTKIETIDSAIRKAGFSGRITPAVRATVRVERYQSSKVAVDYEEWLKWRETTNRPVKKTRSFPN